MKCIMTILLFTVWTGKVWCQQSEIYLDKMHQAIEDLFKVSNVTELQETANSFERIGKKEPNHWHPHYYAAYSYIQMSMHSVSGEEKDRYLDKAQEWISQLKRQYPTNSEVLTLEGFIHMMRIPIDPGSRGPQYSGMSFQALQTAVGLDPENPRAHLVLANMQMGTSRFFGEGIEASCQTLQKALQLFADQKAVHPLDPTWGLDWARSLQDDCEQP